MNLIFFLWFSFAFKFSILGGKYENNSLHMSHREWYFNMCDLIYLSLSCISFYTEWKLVYISLYYISLYFLYFSCIFSWTRKKIHIFSRPNKVRLAWKTYNHVVIPWNFKLTNYFFFNGAIHETQFGLRLELYCGKTIHNDWNYSC